MSAKCPAHPGVEYLESRIDTFVFATLAVRMIFASSRNWGTVEHSVSLGSLLRLAATCLRSSAVTGRGCPLLARLMSTSGNRSSQPKKLIDVSEGADAR